MTWSARAVLTIALGFFAGGCATKGVDGSTHFVCYSDSECPPDQSCSVARRCVSRTVIDAQVSPDSARTSNSSCVPAKGPTNLLQDPLPSGDAFDGLVSDGQNLYFAGGSSIYRIPVSGGVAETLYSGPLVGYLPFAAKSGVVAWVPAKPGTSDPAGLTVSNADGIHSVAFPDGILPGGSAPVVDMDGNVIFDVTLATGGNGRRGNGVQRQTLPLKCPASTSRTAPAA